MITELSEVSRITPRWPEVTRGYRRSIFEVLTKMYLKVTDDNWYPKFHEVSRITPRWPEITRGYRKVDIRNWEFLNNFLKFYI